MGPCSAEQSKLKVLRLVLKVERCEMVKIWALRIREMRRWKKLTQEQLAEKADLSVVTLSTIERGGNTTTDTLERIAKALDVEFSMLFNPANTRPGLAPDQLDYVVEVLAHSWAKMAHTPAMRSMLQEWVLTVAAKVNRDKGL
jgi:transcriptional regulator with XRE-family HTH domain